MRPQREELLRGARGREIDLVLVGGWTARTETRLPYELENITPCIGRDSSGLSYVHFRVFEHSESRLPPL
jgi:hypothetical protein